MSKRKTDEQRADDWVYLRQSSKATQADAYLAGIRSECRAIKRRQMAKAEALLVNASRDEYMSRIHGDIAGAQQTAFRIGGMLEAFKALGIGEVVSALLPVGTRIRFLRDLREGATGDHPAFIYARKDEGGEITGHGTSEGYWVKWDGWPHPFGASRDEFEPIDTPPAMPAKE